MLNKEWEMQSILFGLKEHPTVKTIMMTIWLQKRSLTNLVMAKTRRKMKTVEKYFNNLPHKYSVNVFTVISNAVKIRQRILAGLILSVPVMNSSNRRQQVKFLDNKSGLLVTLWDADTVLSLESSRYICTTGCLWSEQCRHILTRHRQPVDLRCPTMVLLLTGDNLTQQQSLDRDIRIDVISWQQSGVTPRPSVCLYQPRNQ